MCIRDSHQHGCVLAAAVDLDILAAVAENGTNKIRVLSDGYDMLEIDLSDLKPMEEEKNTSAALIRGIAAKLAEMGYKINGFNAYMISNVLKGSGLSSSAAFEVIICLLYTSTNTTTLIFQQYVTLSRQRLTEKLK